MNNDTLNLFSLWTGYFIKKSGTVIFHQGIKDRFLLFLNKLSHEEVPNIRKQIENITLSTEIQRNHPLNLIMYKFITKHEHEFDQEFVQNINNIKKYFE